MPKFCPSCQVAVLHGTDDFDIKIEFENWAPMQDDFTLMKVSITQAANEQINDLLADFVAAWEEGKQHYSFIKKRDPWFVVGEAATSKLKSQFRECSSKNPVEQ